RLLDVALVHDAARPVLEPADRLLESRDLLLLRDVQLLLALQLELAGDGVGGVVAGPQADSPLTQLRGLPDRLLEQVAVVGGRETAAAAPRARALPRRGAPRARRATGRPGRTAGTPQVRRACAARPRESVSASRRPRRRGRHRRATRAPAPRSRGRRPPSTV